MTPEEVIRDIQNNLLDMEAVLDACGRSDLADKAVDDVKRLYWLRRQMKTH